MEKLKAKHDHKLTDILKVAIFAIFLMLPFLVYAPNALYYGVNEYAVAQEKTEQVPIYFESNDVNSVDDLVIGNVYTLNFPLNTQTTNDSYINIDKYWIIDGHIYDTGTGQTTSNLIPNFRLLNNYIYLYYEYVTSATAKRYQYSEITMDFIYLSKSTNFVDYQILSKCERNYVKEYEEITYTMSIAESMNKAWQQTWETPMFNWTSESVLKQGIDNFTDVFGVSDTSYFTNLIVYELIMVAIYIVIDIVLTLFKWLTHLIGEK